MLLVVLLLLDQDAAPADSASVNALVKGIRGIVGVVLEGKGDPNATKTKDDQQKTIGKLFDGTKANSTDAEAAAASASIGTVTGSDILQAIIKSTENPSVDVANGIEKTKDAAEIAIAPAVAGKQEIKEVTAKKDSVIAAGITLRAMAKGGKFAAKNEEKSAHAVNGVAASAINKVLSTLTIAIRNTVDEGLKEINRVLGEVKQGEGSTSKVNE